MSATLEKPAPPEAVEQQLHDLEDGEQHLDRRTSWLERTNPVAVLLGLLAVGVSVVALFFALSARSDRDARQLDRAFAGASAPTAQPATMGGMAAGGKMGAPGAVAQGKVSVQLGDFTVKPSAPAVQAGKVTFVARNVGKVEHELMIERMPMKTDGPGQPNEEAAQGMIEDMQPGQSGRMTVKLTPGKYVLFCNVPGHYAAGQHLPFKVTRS
jgi:uncharacterized cupredoxin-like copper-binding protein